MFLDNSRLLFFFIVDFIIIMMLFFAILLVLSYNPLHASLFLVFLFFLSGLLLMLLNAGFLGFLFIIVYAGAIAVLFIFIVMMLNLRRISLFSVYSLKSSLLSMNGFDKNEERFSFFQIILLLFFLIFFFFFGKIIINYYLPFYQSSFTFYANTELAIVNMLVYYLYDQYMFVVFISGLLLLVAMLGAILITEPYRYTLVREKDFEQINKKITDVVLLYKKNKL